MFENKIITKTVRVCAAPVPGETRRKERGTEPTVPMRRPWRGGLAILLPAPLLSVFFFFFFFFFACRGFGEIVFIDLQREYSGDKWRKGVSVDGTKD